MKLLVKKAFFWFSYSMAGLLLIPGCLTSGKTRIMKTETSLLPSILYGHSPLMDTSLLNKDSLKIQIIYTQIDRRQDGSINFTDHYFNVNLANYFYPASTVKFPVAVLALQRLRELKIPGLDRQTMMITEAGTKDQTIVYNDPTAPGGKPCIDQYIRKILLVSDNDAFNRLYEFLGQEYINNTLHKMGYKDARIIHRLSLNLSEEQNRLTNPLRFLDTNGNTLYEQALIKSRLVYQQREEKMGIGFIRGEELIREPFDFSAKNRLSLVDLHAMLRAVLFPGSVAAKKRFGLEKEDYSFLYKYLSMYPRESVFPFYDSMEYKDSHAKLFLSEGDAAPKEGNIRVFSKAGWAYGFLTDIAYITDSEKHIEFMLSATIYCNNDGIFNDDKYDYEKIGYPFMRSLARRLYEYELKRERTIVTDLSGR